MKRMQSPQQVHVIDREGLVQEINTHLAQGRQNSAIYDTIRLGISDGRQGRPVEDCPLSDIELRIIWKLNWDLGFKNSRKTRGQAPQQDFSTTPLGFERSQDTNTLKP